MSFVAAEDIISAHAYLHEEEKLIGHDLANRNRISYAAAYRLKCILIKDLRQVGGGLFGVSVCLRDLKISRDPRYSQREWLNKLFSEILDCRH